MEPITIEQAENSERFWRESAKESGCWCAGMRRPCGYHEGYDDGMARAWALIKSGAVI